MAIKQKTKSLKRKEDKLADPFYQLEVLSGINTRNDSFVSFTKQVSKDGWSSIKPSQIDTFQLNIGKLCNQTCAHCHVDAGPDRTEENMDKDMLQKCLKIIALDNFKMVDITGGAPEMNKHFRWFVAECFAMGKKVIVRCNLTIIMANKKYHDLPDFYAKHQVEVVSSLPYFSKTRTDAQRGIGVFNDSIEALKKLNDRGYGKAGSGLVLNLVFNPSGAFLPGDQVSLESEFKSQLKRRFDISFNNLFAITNLPVNRFLDYLIETNNYESYMEKLLAAYNPAVINGLMCRNILSVSWDGYIYDCDFNQMLDLKVDSKYNHINDFDLESLQNRKIVLNNHCYGCTAGSGSSCGGEIS